MQKQFLFSIFFFIDSLVVSSSQYTGGYAIPCQNKLELHLGCHFCRLLTYFTLVCLWYGRTVAQLGNVWIDFLSPGALPAWSSAIKPFLNFRKGLLGRTSRLKICKLFGFLSLLMIKKNVKCFFFAVNVDTGNTRSVMLTDQLCQNSNQIPATVQVSWIVLYNKDAKLLIITINNRILWLAFSQCDWLSAVLISALKIKRVVWVMPVHCK